MDPSLFRADVRIAAVQHVMRSLGHAVKAQGLLRCDEVRGALGNGSLTRLRPRPMMEWLAPPRTG